MEEVVQVFQLIILMATFTMLFFVGLLGNGMVIFTIAKFKHLRWPINVLIANICFCNNLILILGVPWYVFQLSVTLKKKYQTFNCYSLVAIMVVSTSLALTHAAIAVERYICTTMHWKMNITFTKRKAFLTVGFVNLFAISLGFYLLYPRLNSRNLERKSTKLSVRECIVLVIIHYILPLIVMCLCYYKTFAYIRRKNKRIVEHLNISAKAKLSMSVIRKALSEMSLGMLYAERELIIDTEEQHDKYAWLQTPDKHVFNNDRSDINKRLAKCQSLNNLPTNRSLSKTTSLRHSASNFRRSLRSVITGESSDIELNRLAHDRWKQTLQTFKGLSYIVFLFAFCQWPHHLMLFTNAQNIQLNPNLVNIFKIFFFAEIAITPYLYSGMNKMFLVAYKLLLRKILKRSRRSNPCILMKHVFKKTCHIDNGHVKEYSQGTRITSRSRHNLPIIVISCPEESV